MKFLNLLIQGLQHRLDALDRCLRKKWIPALGTDPSRDILQYEDIAFATIAKMSRSIGVVRLDNESTSSRFLSSLATGLVPLRRVRNVGRDYGDIVCFW